MSDSEPPIPPPVNQGPKRRGRPPGIKNSVKRTDWREHRILKKAVKRYSNPEDVIQAKRNAAAIRKNRMTMRDVVEKKRKVKIVSLDMEKMPKEIEEYAKALRDRYQLNLDLFCLNTLHIVDRDDPAGGALIPFRLNPCQLALDRYIKEIELFNVERSKVMHRMDSKIPVTPYPINVVILKARKTGVSTYLQARGFHKAEFTPHTNCLIMAHEVAASKNILKISKRFNDYFRNSEMPPEFEEKYPGFCEKYPQLIIRKPITRASNDTLEWGSSVKGIPPWDSRIIVKTANTSSSGASRSFTWHFCHISEEAHFPRSDEVSAALNACVKYSETYEESTAKGTGGLFYNSWQNALTLEEVKRMWRAGEPFPTNWNGKFKFFWSWLDDPAYRRDLQDWEHEHILNTLSAREEDLLTRFKVSVEQIAFRRWKLTTECSSQTDMEPEAYYDQEYPTEPNDAFVASGMNAFSGKSLLYMKENQRVPVWTGEIFIDPQEDPIMACRYVENAQRQMLVRYEWPRDDRDYIIGIDTALGLREHDDSIISIFDRVDGLRLVEVARVVSKLKADELAILAYKLGFEYNEAFIIAEANYIGAATNLKLVRLQYPNLYHRENPERISDTENNEAFTAGFVTLKNNKALLVAEGQSAIRNEQLLLLHPIAIEQWLHFSNDNGHYSAPSGEKDDCVMADLLAIYAHFTAKAPPVRRYKSENEVREKLEAEGESPEAIRFVLHRKKIEDAKKRTSSIKRVPLSAYLRW